MIPKASQRGNGQDLATHLLNAHDNEYLEVAYLRGAVAGDLHGAFAEWELQAQTLTRCSNYLYSLSINPDDRQGALTRDQYLAYIERAEASLGLAHQPRAVVFHIKDGREHCHVIWSRIDAANGKAIHQAFDHEKLMAVTRQFAREHGIVLPEGMTRNDGKTDYRDKVTLYDRRQEAATGLSKEERVAQVTEAYRQSDSPQAFVRALEGMGYILATGNRPYVLVDAYGSVNALPRMIADKSVRTKDIVAFLGGAFPADSLPTVDEAKALVKSHLKAMNAFDKASARQDQFDALSILHAQRRSELEQERAETLRRHSAEKHWLSQQQRGERYDLRATYREERRAVRVQREANKPRGLADFLGRITGINAVRQAIHRAQDVAQFKAHREVREKLVAGQDALRLQQAQRHSLQVHELDRRGRAMAQVEKRERESLEQSLVRKARTKRRGEDGRMPTLNLDLLPERRVDAPRKAMTRHRNAAERKLWQEFEDSKLRSGTPDLARDFARASGDGGDSSEGRQGGDDGRAPRRARTRAPRGPRPRSRG